jgi:glycosyltransferase involved in cell wall biosynthesis
MKVLYDHQIFSEFPYGGISQIFSFLLSSFRGDPDVTCTLSLKYSDNVYLSMLDLERTVRPYLSKFSRTGNKNILARVMNKLVINKVNSIGRLFNRTHSSNLLQKGDYDLFHPTYYDPYFIQYLGNKPFVLTVYDMIHELFPKYFTSATHIAKWKLLLMQKAATIIAISESTKNDIVNICNISPSKIKVVYLATSLKSDISSVPENASITKPFPERYLLFVGSRENYKNFSFFINSIAPLLNQDVTLSIICAGGPIFTRKEIADFHALGINNQIFHYAINDRLLATFYRNAIAFVFPSLYEGFGIPILEAYSCGCPVLISDTSSLPEIADEACLKFNPTDSISLVEAIKQVLSSNTLREELIRRGYRRNNLFSWQKTASETKQVYKSILA